MTQLTKEDLIEVLELMERKREKELQEDPIHISHHEFVQEMIDARKRRAELWSKFQSSLIGGFALAILGFLGWIGNLVVEWVRSGGSH